MRVFEDDINIIPVRIYKQDFRKLALDLLKNKYIFLRMLSDFVCCFSGENY